MQTEITFVNHASVVIRHGDIALLSDPWYGGDAFHKGWNLLVETPEDTARALLGGITHIWLSHEHPDHFSVRFFQSFGPLLRDRDIPILFQTTRDKRVRTFLEGIGLRVIELPFDTAVDIGGGVCVTCLKDGFYDSGLLVEAGGEKILNLNDCEVTTAARAAEVFAVTGPVDVLLTQFSFAAWKGGPDNTAWRQEAAEEKLNTVALQIDRFSPRHVIPFASFVYFSNRRNFYLNDAVNRPRDVADRFADSPAHIIPMQPGDVFDGRPDPARIEAALAFWDARYDALEKAPLNHYDPVPAEELAKANRAWVRRIRANNSVLLMRAIRRLSPIGGLKPVVIELDDTGQTLLVDPLTEGMQPTTLPADLRMGSASLMFIFSNSFGFDTLSVNGCFEEARTGGFVHATKTLAIENLNNLGIHISAGLLVNASVIRLFLGRLLRVSRKLKRG